MRIYLDLCCLQRPFDDQAQARIRDETVALERVLDSVRDETLMLVSSDALTRELAENPHPIRRAFAESCLSMATEHVSCDESINEGMNKWLAKKVPPLDSLHLACAEAIGVDAFVTCDDILLKRSKRVRSSLRIVGLLQFTAELGP